MVTRSLLTLLPHTALLLALTIPAASEVVVLQADRDNTIYSEGEENNGGGQGLFVGRTSSGSTRRALLRFDMAAIPAGAVITGATLTLNMNKAPSGSPSANVSVHRLRQDWGEGSAVASRGEGGGTTAPAGTATWTTPFTTTGASWPAGGDFETASSASTAVPATSASRVFQGSGLQADVQAWVNGDVPNHGWILIGDESTTRTARRFASSEFSTAAQRPQLQVVYTVPTPTFGEAWVLF